VNESLPIILVVGLVVAVVIGGIVTLQARRRRHAFEKTDPDPDPDPDTLTLAEAVLLKMGDAIPDPTTLDSHPAFYAAMVGVRGRSLYENFLHSLTSSVDIGPLLAIRPLIEAAILAKWISLDPDLHGQLWFAQSEDRDVTAMREAEKNLGVRVRGELPTDVIVESIEEKEAFRDAAVARAKAAGKNYGKRPMPPLEQMVTQIAKADPDHKVAMRQAYDLAYRSFSPWEHTEAASFKATAERTANGVKFLGDVSPVDQEVLRLIAGAMFAYILEINGLAAGDGSEVLARMVRDYLTVVRGREAGPDGPDTP
jgi:hypothetical protein